LERQVSTDWHFAIDSLTNDVYLGVSKISLGLNTGTEDLGVRRHVFGRNWSDWKRFACKLLNDACFFLLSEFVGLGGVRDGVVWSKSTCLQADATLCDTLCSFLSPGVKADQKTDFTPAERLFSLSSLTSAAAVASAGVGATEPALTTAHQ
jgi:hypothetical protein